MLNETFHLGPDSSGEDPHEGLGGEPVLGALLVVSLGHVGEHLVGGLVDVMDDLTKVGLEVLGSKALQVVEGCWRDVSLPLQVTLATLNQVSEAGGGVDKVNKALLQLKVLGGDGALAGGGQSNSGLLVGLNGLPGGGSSLSHVASKDNDVEVLVDVVHDLGLEEGLGSIIHDLIGQLGLSNVLPELLDASAAGLLGAIQINDLVSIVLSANSILQSGHKLLDNLKLSSEESVLGWVHDIPVSLEQSSVDSGNSLHKTLKGGRDLELLEEAGNDGSGGGSGKADLVIDNDGGVDVGAHQSLAHDVIVGLQRGGRVADRHSPVNQTGELLLQSLDGLAQALELLDLNLRLLLVDINNLELAAIGALAALALSQEGSLLGLDDVPGDGSQLGVLANLVGWPGADGGAIDIDGGLLPQVEPDDGAVLGVDGAAHLLKALLETLQSRLAAGVDLEAGNSSEVGDSGDGVRKLLDLVEMIGHTDRLLHVAHGGYREVRRLELDKSLLYNYLNLLKTTL